MPTDQNHELAEDRPRSVLLRRVISAPIGALCGLVASLAIMEGVWSGHGSEVLANRDHWTFFVWADHYVWRVAASCVAAGIAGTIAGTISRGRGGLFGLLSTLPATLVWAWILVAALTGHFLFVAYGDPDVAWPANWGLAAMAAGCMTANVFFGWGCGSNANEVTSVVDPGAIRFHCLYLAPLAVVSLTLSSCSAVPFAYCLRSLVKVSSADPIANFIGWLGSLLLMAIIFLFAAAMGAPWFGLSSACEAIADHSAPGRVRRILVGCVLGPSASLGLIALGSTILEWMASP